MDYRQPRVGQEIMCQESSFLVDGSDPQKSPSSRVRARSTPKRKTEAFFLARTTATPGASTGGAYHEPRAPGVKGGCWTKAADSVPWRGTPLAKGFGWLVRARGGSPEASRPDAMAPTGMGETLRGAQDAAGEGHGTPLQGLSRCRGQTTPWAGRRAVVEPGMRVVEEGSWFVWRDKRPGVEGRHRGGLEGTDVAQPAGATSRAAVPVLIGWLRFGG